jgi:hypothetical protein
MRIPYLLGFLVLISCQNVEKNHNAKDNKAVELPLIEQTKPNFSGLATDSVLSNYLYFAESLVMNNSVEANINYNKLKQSVNNNTAASSIQSIVKGSKDTSIQQLRIVLEKLATPITNYAKLNNKSGTKLFKVYCSMAFDFKGAYWISKDTIKRNPYFGNEMLDCGDIIDSL